VKPAGARSAVKDGQKFDVHRDKTRDKCMELIYDALVFDSDSRECSQLNVQGLCERASQPPN
jgi:hypothetical protein